MASYSVLCVRRDTMDNKHFITLVSVLIAIITLAGCIITRHLPLAHKNTKAPTNSRIFDYSFVNLLFDEENGSQIFWLAITSAHLQHLRGGVSVTLAQNLQLLLSLSARCQPVWAQGAGNSGQVQRTTGLSHGKSRGWRLLRFEHGLTPSEVSQMLELISRHWCDRDVNEQLEKLLRIGQTRIRRTNLPHGNSCQIARQRQ